MPSLPWVQPTVGTVRYSKTTGVTNRIRNTIGIVLRIPGRQRSLRLYWMEKVSGHKIACGNMWL